MRVGQKLCFTLEQEHQPKVYDQIVQRWRHIGKLMPIWTLDRKTDPIPFLAGGAKLLYFDSQGVWFEPKWMNCVTFHPVRSPYITPIGRVVTLLSNGRKFVEDAFVSGLFIASGCLFTTQSSVTHIDFNGEDVSEIQIDPLLSFLGPTPSLLPSFPLEESRYDRDE